MTTLAAQSRKDEKVRDLRAQGFLPAVVYGRKDAATPISVSGKEFKKAYAAAGESGVVELTGLGDTKDVLIHDVALDPLTGEPVHADFYAIEKGQKVTVSIPLSFIGESPAVKDKGAVLVKVMHELEVMGEPKHLPHEIEVDLAPLFEIDSRITVADITLPSGVEASADAGEVIVMATEAKEEEEAEEAPMDITQIGDAVERGKKEEEGDGAATEA